MKKLAILLVVLLASTHLNSQWISNYWANGEGDSPILNSKGLAVTVDDNNYCYVTGYTYCESTGYDIILIKYAPAGDTVFTRIYSGSGSEEDKAFGIVVDRAENIYITGQLSVAGKSTELVLLKYSNTGNLLWVKTFGDTTTAKPDKGQALELDGYGNIYVTGYCIGDDGYKDIIVQKYTPEGTLVWTTREDGDGNMDSEGNSIAVIDDFVLVTGYTTSVNNAVLLDVITLKYNTDGILQWGEQYNGAGNKNDVAYGIACSDENSVYVAGYTTAGNDTANTSTLIIKYSKNGVLKWAKTYESGNQGSSDKAFGIIVDSENRIYITGQTGTQSDGLDYLTIRYGHSGTEQWVAKYNGPGHGNDVANSISTLTNGEVVVTGASLGMNNNFDFATVTINKNSGEIQNISRYSMTANSNDIALDVATSTDNHIYVTGFSELSTDFQGNDFSYLTTISLDVNSDPDGIKTNVPNKFELFQNYPNPFNPSTNIKFHIPDKMMVNLVVYDIMGRVVDVLVSQNLEAGTYNITYKNTNLASGIYFYQLTAGEYKDVKKMTFVK